MVQQLEASTGISMRSKTTLVQRLPAKMEDKINKFHMFVLRFLGVKEWIRKNLRFSLEEREHCWCGTPTVAI